jgi:hypothetical protein
MAATTFQPNYYLLAGITRLRRRLGGRGLYFGLILLTALVAFEIFNFATTEYALDTLFGNHDALGVATWATVLAIAFCGIDFAGLSRLFTPETGRKEPKEIWLLTGAWFLGAGMNALMTWWAVGSALAANPMLGNELLSRADILHYGPIFIALLVWLTRTLIIGTFAFTGDHIFSTAGQSAGAVVDGRARPVVSGSQRPSSIHTPERPPAISQPRSAAPRPAAVLSNRSEAVESSSYYARAADDSDGRRSYESPRNFFGQGAGRSYQSPAALRHSFEPGQPIASKAAPQSGYTAAVHQPSPGSNGRASTTRTVSASHSDGASTGFGTGPVARQATSSPVQSSLELEYVDLD